MICSSCIGEKVYFLLFSEGFREPISFVDFKALAAQSYEFACERTADFCQIWASNVLLRYRCANRTV